MSVDRFGGPWEAVNTYAEIAGTSSDQIRNANGDVVAWLPQHLRQSAPSHADIIVLAVNDHARLVQIENAARGVLRAWREFGPERGFDDVMEVLLGAALEARP